VAEVHLRQPPGKSDQLHDSDITAFVKGYRSTIDDEEDRNLTVETIEVRDDAIDSGEVHDNMSSCRSAFDD
jgi:hypothetical protein